MPIFTSSNFKGLRHLSGGFTLIEMLIVVGIISLLVSLTASSGALGRREFLLTAAGEELRSLITRAKSLSVSTIVSGQSPVCGYGVHIDRLGRQVFIFRDLPQGGNCPGDNRYSGSDERLTGLLNEVKLDSVLSLGSDLDVVFIPPDPTTIIGGNLITTEAEIVITGAGGEARRIKINKAGLIDLITR